MNMNHSKFAKTYGILAFLVILFTCVYQSHGLYPVETATREIKKLDGLWTFRILHQDDQEQGFREKWYNKSLKTVGDVLPMPVPSSFNDITQNKTIRDYLGWSWYETEFYLPFIYLNEVILRFGSAHYHALVYVNGFLTMNHTGGHLPFEANVTGYLKRGKNRLTVALNNTLSSTTIPQGGKQFKSPKDGPYPPGFYTQTTNFDFFNYAGIHRSVLLYILPQYYIKDVTINTDVQEGKGIVTYKIEASYDPQDVSSIICEVEILDKQGIIVAKLSSTCSGTLAVDNAMLWWPYTMHDNPGYQYTVKVQVKFLYRYNSPSTDIYLQKIGFRTIEVTKYKFFVNGQPFYFTGFGKHEDSNIRGKGLDLPLIIKDMNLIKWIGANSFRTSHYPYAEELMDQADEQGIVVIDECPAVGLTSFTEDMKKQHLQILTELVARDRNRPSVFAWSVANEPQSSKPEADDYFSAIVNHVKKLDSSRPVTAALNQNHDTDKAGKHMDYIMYNHYYAWYSDMGSTETIIPLLTNNIVEAFSVYGKPIMMSEYGADTIVGLHTNPSLAFTEDYQIELMARHHKAFDILKQKGYFIGEHIWNFADFQTIQQENRVVGNKKGIFTRERQPKASAHILRCRYHKLAGIPLNDSSGYCQDYTISENQLCINI